MSWDVMIFKYAGAPPKDVEDASNNQKSEPLGEAGDVRDSISKHLPGVDWSDPAWGVYEGNGFSIEFNTGAEGPIDSIMLHVRGGGDPIASMLQFAVPNQWSLLDCSTGEFIDPANPSQEGWEGFQEYRDQIMNQYRDDEET